jgi:hypothetical protein
MSATAAHDPRPDLVVWDKPVGPLRRAIAPVAQAVQRDDARRLGLRTTGAMARRFNRGGERFVDSRRRLYEERFDELLEANGGRPADPIVLEDGFAFDESRSLPQLDALLADGEDLIERYAGGIYELEKGYLQDISPDSAMDTHPSLLDFVTSSEVVAAAAPAFGFVPALPGTIPQGVRLMESSTEHDSSPTVYVIVALRDIDPEDGPLHFIGKAASRRVIEKFGYGRRGVPYRLTDEAVYSVVDPGEVHRFAVPAGTVLFIESSACFHFGSRRPAKPRFQIQYSFASPVRSDFMELWRPQRVFPVRPSDSELRRLVLDRSRLG